MYIQLCYSLEVEVESTGENQCLCMRQRHGREAYMKAKMSGYVCCVKKAEFVLFFIIIFLHSPKRVNQSIQICVAINIYWNLASILLVPNYSKGESCWDLGLFFRLAVMINLKRFFFPCFSIHFLYISTHSLLVNMLLAEYCIAKARVHPHQQKAPIWL